MWKIEMILEGVVLVFGVVLISLALIDRNTSWLPKWFCDHMGWQLISKSNLFWSCNWPEMLNHMQNHLMFKIFTCGISQTQDSHNMDTVPFKRMRKCYCSCFSNSRMTSHNTFYFCCSQTVSTYLYDILCSPDNPEIAILIYLGRIPG